MVLATTGQPVQGGVQNSVRNNTADAKTVDSIVSVIPVDYD